MKPDFSLKYLKNTLAVVVLYNEKIKNSKTLVTLRKADTEGIVLDVLVYDNSPHSQKIDEEKFDKFNFTYIHDPSNPGVSTAYNLGAKQAMVGKKKWLLILDQDTSFEQNIFSAYGQAIQRHSDIHLFVPILKIDNCKILSPCSFKHYYGSHLEKVNFGRQKFNDNSVVNSGILVTLKSFYSVGGYNENVRLDLSDHQFIEKYKKSYNEFVVIESFGFQSFSVLEDDGNKELVRFRFYCQGVNAFETTKRLGKSMLKSQLLLKTIKKTFKNKSLRFFEIFFEEVFGSANRFERKNSR